MRKKISQSNHIRKVLRQKIGDEIIICNTETSQDYQCKIENILEEKIVCNIIEKIETTNESNVKVTIFQGLPKADKMELVVTNTIPLEPEKQIDKVKVVSIAPLFAEAIKRINEERPLGDLFEYDK